MDYGQSFAISAAGMAAERTRVDTAALNLANANTVQTPDGAAFQPMRVIARSVGAAGAGVSFAARIDEALAGEEALPLEIPQVSVEPSAAAPRSVYEPGHPFADARGFVNYPSVDTATEMVTLMSAMRAYEANVVAMNTTRTLVLKALDIGGGNS